MGLKKAARKKQAVASSSSSSQPPKETPEKNESSEDVEQQQVQEEEEEAEAEKPITPPKPQQPQPSDSDPEETHLGPPIASGLTKSVAASKPKKPTSAKRKPYVEKPITPTKPRQPQSSDSDPGSDPEETHLGSVAASKPKKPTSAKRLMQEFEKNAQKKTKKAARVVVQEEEKDESSEDVEEKVVQEEEAEAEKAEKTKLSVERPITPTKPQQPQSSDSDPEETHLGSVAASKPRKPTSAKRLMSEFENNAQKKNKKKARVVVEEEEKDESSEDVEEQVVQEEEEEEEKAEKKKSAGAIIRVWSEEDEVLILKGLVDFQTKNGSDQFPDMVEFQEQIKESLSVDVSNKRFVDKIRKLKGKYNANVAKWEKAVFSRPHERQCFELSKKIWGGGKEDGGIGENDGKEGALGDEKKKGVDANGTSSRSKRARKTVELDGKGKEKVGLGEELKGGGMKDMEVDEVVDFWVVHPCLKESLEMETETGLPSDLLRKNPVRIYLRENMRAIGNEKAMEMEKKWKNMRAEEVALSLKRQELMNEQTKLVLDATNASKD